MMSKTVIGLVGIGVGLGAGYFFFATPDKGAMDESMPGLDGTMHSHAMLEVDMTKPVPSVSVDALEDAKDGYNIRLTTANYTWTPEKVNGTPVQGEGHAHIYVNGVKVARLYGEWFHLPTDKLLDGENVIEVTLNANDHSEWVQDGEHIAATVTLTK